MHRDGVYVYAAFLCHLSDEPLPRQNNQAQAAEDILDKYRNIKRPSPSDVASAGASYDGPGGQGTKLASTRRKCSCIRQNIEVFFSSVSTDLCVEDNVNDAPREDGLQNISADDLPDSASQTAQQHDSKFSFRLHYQYPEKKQNKTVLTVA